jgi:hypothetical protein
VGDRLLLRLPLTAVEIRNHDRQLRAWFQTIRANYRPGEVTICHHEQWFLWGFRQFQYHLPEYDNLLVTPDRALLPPVGGSFWRARNRQTEYLGQITFQPGSLNVLVAPPGADVQEFTNVLDVADVKSLPVDHLEPLYFLQVRTSTVVRAVIRR